MLAARRGAGAGLPDADGLSDAVRAAREAYRVQHQRLVESALRDFFIRYPTLNTVDWRCAGGGLLASRGVNGPRAALGELSKLLAGVDHQAIADGHAWAAVSAGRDGRLRIVVED